MQRGKNRTYHDLFIEQLDDLYEAETKLIQALPTMIVEATATELKSLCELHLKESKEHVHRLEFIFHKIGERPTAKTDETGQNASDSYPLSKSHGQSGGGDAALMGRLLRAKNFEIAAYTAVRIYAKLTGYYDAELFLKATLMEERATEKRLTLIAQELKIRIPYDYEIGTITRQKVA